MNKADKRKIIFAITTIANNYKNKEKPKVPQSLKELADEYDSFWLWFGGKRSTRHKRVCLHKSKYTRQKRADTKKNKRQR